MGKRLRQIASSGEESWSETLSDLSLSMVGILLIAFTGYVLKFQSVKEVTQVETPPVPTEEPPHEKPELIGLNGPMTNVVYCLDLSGSMIGQGAAVQRYSQSEDELKRRFQEVKERLKLMVSNHPFDQFTVIGFGGMASDGKVPRLVTTSPHLAAASPFSRADACRHIDSWQAGGGTPTLPALQRAVSLIGVEHIVLLTDGLPTLEGTQEDVLAYVGGSRRHRSFSSALPSHIVIDVIGIGDQSVQPDEEAQMALLTFTRRVAELTGGFFQAW
ncbi:hypothetical protein Pla123a_44590 [Posidoniimonas polymericola]|uniref:VWFA domain-containing protein n=1 Tax=Posidoniimonas polymericola TaxID=2528002 RepID=A0A5C5XWX5_9BACT|nr:VWA domain-containing protein [Posidoniimonas polymericola]TWT67029.1 hypothetical protein Pla123a_44590 [Posidoniimonas polymericola]